MVSIEQDKQIRMYHHSLLLFLTLLFFTETVSAQHAHSLMPANPGSIWMYQTDVFDEDEILAQTVRSDSIESILSAQGVSTFLISSEPAGAYEYRVSDDRIGVQVPLATLLGNFDLPVGIIPGNAELNADLFHTDTSPDDEWTLQELRQPIEISDEIREEFSIPAFIDSVDFVIRLGGKRLNSESVMVPFGEFQAEVFDIKANVRLETEVIVFGSAVTVYIELVEAYVIRNWLAEGLGIIKQHAEPYLIDFSDLDSTLPFAYANEMRTEEDDDDEDPNTNVIPGFETVLLSFSEGEPVSANDSDQVPQNFAIHSVYPNPFNPSTTVNFSLENAASVRLDLYSVTGQRVLSIHDGFLNAGNHHLSVDAGNLSSGIYILLLSSGQQTESKRITLIK